MSYVYLICFLLLAVGVIFLLGLTPEMITDDLMRFVSPKQTLREQILTVKGKKKSKKLTLELHRIRDALEKTGKGKQFTIACAASLLFVIAGCVIAIVIDNAYLIPVFAVAFALIPFAYAKRTISLYENHIKEELETALSIITTSYLRTDDIVTAVKENVEYLKPPVKDIFAGFVAENMLISADTNAKLVNCKFIGAQLCFADFSGTVLQNCEMNYLSVDEMDMSRAYLENCDLSYLIVCHCNFAETQFVHCQLFNGKTHRCCFENANFYHTKTKDSYIDPVNDSISEDTWLADNGITPEMELK